MLAIDIGALNCQETRDRAPSWFQRHALQTVPLEQVEEPSTQLPDLCARLRRCASLKKQTLKDKLLHNQLAAEIISGENSLCEECSTPLKAW